MGSALAGTCPPAQIWVVIRLGTGGRWAGSPLASLLLKLLWQMGKFPYLQLLVMSVFLQVLKALSFSYIFALLTMPWVKKLGMSLVTNDQLTAAKLLRNTAELGLPTEWGFPWDTDPAPSHSPATRFNPQVRKLLPKRIINIHVTISL